MTVQTLTLTDFLLARIDEETAGARLLAERDAKTGIRTEWLGFLPGRGSMAEHVRAECESKRQIVERAQGAHQSLSDTMGVTESARRLGWFEAFDLTLRLLALPYADHPDYRDEWRP